MKTQEVVLVSRKCYECGQKMIGRKENYQYTEAGLKSVTLTNVLVFHCTCGNIVAELPAVGQLHHLIAFDLLRKESILSGEEARFLRKWIGYSATQLAETTGYSKTIISRWENGRQDIGKEPDRLLRLVVIAVWQESLSEDGNGLSKQLIDKGRVMENLNIPELLRKIENRCDGSKAIRIDPSLTDLCLTVQ